MAKRHARSRPAVPPTVADCPECEVCCAVALCCQPGSALQLQALSKGIQAHRKCSHAKAEAAAKRVLARYDHFKDAAALCDPAADAQPAPLAPAPPAEGNGTTPAGDPPLE